MPAAEADHSRHGLQITWLVIAAFVLLSAFLVSRLWLNPIRINSDVSWLLLLGERIAAGARPYIDFIETNPPASILIYMPAVFLSHWTGLPPSSMLLVLIVGGATWSVVQSGSIAMSARLMTAREAPWFAALILTLLLILPTYSFGQREHLALIAVLPMLATYAVRASGQKPHSIVALLSGLGAGVTVAIKPHFALALVLPLILVLWRARRTKRDVTEALFAPENLAAALVCIAYAAAVFVFFPVFIHKTLPFDVVAYLPFRQSLWAMITNQGTLLFALGLVLGCALSVGGQKLDEPIVAISGLGAIGFALAFFIQAKGFTYHSYPAIALTMLAVGILVIRRGQAKSPPQPGQWRFVRIAGVNAIGLAFLALLFAQGAWFGTHYDLSKVIAAVARVGPQHPRILSLGWNVQFGQFPVRRLQGKWVGREAVYWTGSLDQILKNPELPQRRRPALMRYDRELASVAADDIHDGRPDIILIFGKQMLRSALSHPEVAAALRKYHKIESVGVVEIWGRSIAGQKTQDANA